MPLHFTHLHFSITSQKWVSILLNNISILELFYYYFIM
jgi:hypothetical protein